MKKPILTPEDELPELEYKEGCQVIEVDFRDEANEFLIITFVTIFVTLEKSGGDGYITPNDIWLKKDIHEIEYHCFDFDGNRVIDEGGVIYKELEKIIKGEYEN